MLYIYSCLLNNIFVFIVLLTDLKQEIQVIQSSKTTMSSSRKSSSSSPLDSNKLPDSTQTSVKSKLNKAYRNTLAWSCLRPQHDNRLSEWLAGVPRAQLTNVYRSFVRCVNWCFTRVMQKTYSLFCCKSGFWRKICPGVL